MQPIYQNTMNFPVYQNGNKIEEIEEVEDENYYDIAEHNQLFVNIMIEYSKNIVDLSFEDYKNLKTKFKMEESDKELFLCNIIFAQYSYNELIISEALKEINETDLNKNRDSFVNICIQSAFYHEGNDERQKPNKCKLLIDLGEGVNQMGCRINESDEVIYNETPLEFVLNKNLDNSFLLLLITSGGVVYNPLTLEQQARVNAIMQPIVKEFNEKLKITLELFHDKDGTMNVFPKELKDMIHMISINSLHSDVVLKILRMN